MKAKGTLPPPQTLPGDGAFFIFRNPTAEMPQSTQQEPIYEKTLGECEDDDDYSPILFTTRQSDNPTLPGLSLGSPFEVETPLSTFAPLEPENQIPMPAEPSADTNSMKFDVEDNTAYEGRKNWTGDGEDAPVGSAQASSTHGDYDTPRSRHNWLSSSAVAHYLPPDLESNLMRKITPTNFERNVEQVPVNTTQQQVLEKNFSFLI